MSGLVFLIDESGEEEVVKSETKEEHELGIIHSWMQVGAFPVLPEEETQGLLWEVGFSSCLIPIWFPV